MLYAEEHELEAIRVSERRKCVVCEHKKRFAAWRVVLKNDDPNKLVIVTMCSWCVMYSGKSQWGHENREELAAVGVLCKTTAEQTGGRNTHIPKLDKRHRLNRQDADKWLLGVQFTSRALRKKLRPVMNLHVKSES